MPDPMPQQINLAQRLRLAREQAGLSQGQVAHLMNVHRPTISEIEAGRRRVSADELVQFARHYRVQSSWLLGETPDEQDLPKEIAVAARQMAKLKPADRDRILDFLKSVTRSGGKR